MIVRPRPRMRELFFIWKGSIIPLILPQVLFVTAVATLDQIADKGHSLAIPLYVAGAKAADAGEQVNVADAVADWRAAAAASESAIADVLALLRAEVRA